MLKDHLTLQTFKLQEFSDEKLITIAPDTLLTDAISLMHRESTSCVLIKQQGQLQGIFTERDLVKLTASGTEISELAISEVMTKQPITISTTENPNLMALISLLAKHRIRHLPLVDGTGKTLGIITRRSLRKAFKAGYLLKYKQVKEVMHRQVIQATGDRSIFQIANLLATHRVSCVVILETESEEPIYPQGIVTERDLVNFRALGLDLYQIPVAEVMSTPLFSITPDASLWNAHQLMQQHQIRRLVVTNQDGTLAGIITQTTIFQALDRQVNHRTQELEVANASLKREISDRVKAKAKLKASEAKFRAIFEQAAVGIAHVGLDKKLMRVNQKFADILGYTPEELQQLSWDTIIYPDDQASDKKHIQQLMKGEIATLVKEKRYIRKNGSPVWLKLTTAPVRDADGKPEYFISVIEDVSQRKAKQGKEQNVHFPY